VPVRLDLLGSPTVRGDGGWVALPFERRSQLVGYLALKRAWVKRAELAALLWPEQATKHALANLRKTLFRLQSVRWGDGVEVLDDGVRSNAATDVDEFERAIAERRHADALALYRGELLEGFDDDANDAWSDWLRGERERLRAAWRSAALERLAEDGGPAESLELCARLLAIDPLDEAALRAQLACLARGGQVALARSRYREFAERLHAEAGTTPGIELEALVRSLAIVDDRGRPSAATPDDGFVGRAVELARIAELLARDDCRLLCIVGAGGVGKTRLAARAMHALAARYADGAVFVALEDVDSPGEVATALAHAAGVSLRGPREPVEQLSDALRGRRMLLVLDNFEHVTAATATIDRLLAECARLTFLVTSRTRLASPSQWSLPLEGLPWPEREDADRAVAFDAVRLFVQAARRHDPAFAPGDAAESIVDICRSVDGLPLALELAAAWTRVLPCSAIAAELAHGTGLLQATAGTRPARHASLAGVFEQSWKLLAPPERDALARLSLFRGGFVPEAARAVAGASLPVLGSLVDKSLLRRDGERMSLHPLVNDEAATRLDDAARAAAGRAHAEHFHRLLRESRKDVEDGARDALDRIEVEFDNCRAAWRWSVEHGDMPALCGSLATLVDFCEHRGRLGEGRALVANALQAHANDPLAVGFASAIAQFDFRLDRYPEAEARALEALASARSQGDDRSVLQCLNVLGGCALRRELHDDARRWYGEALALPALRNDPGMTAAMLDNLALVEKYVGHYGEALRLSTQSLLEHRRLGDVAGEALCLNNLGSLELDRGKDDAARAHLHAGLALCRRYGLVSTEALIHGNLSDIATKQGDYDTALEHARSALAIGRSIGHRALEAWLHLQFARIAIKRGELGAAREDVAASLEQAVAIGRPGLQVLGVTSFAEILAAQGERECARAVLALVAAHPATSAAARDDARTRLAHWDVVDDAATPPAPLPLAELIQRIVVERAVAHRPLIETLRGVR
jgi:predicted ATPase/DNA-binding SARP family transcriptional activator